MTLFSPAHPAILLARPIAAHRNPDALFTRQGRREGGPQAYVLLYVEWGDRPRTQLETVFSILLSGAR